MIQPIDILAIGVHPDDIELSCSGILCAHLAQGYSVGLLDLTQGELGTRGNAALRLQEAEQARQIMGAVFRHNLELPDGFFQVNRESILELVKIIRLCRPSLILANALRDRHPDHGRAALLVREAVFYAGLQKIGTIGHDGEPQERWRPKAVYHYIQDEFLEPDLVVDITGHFDQKLELIQTFRSQFYDPDSAELETPISGRDFLAFVEARARNFGRIIGAEYGEGLNTNRPPGAPDLLKLL